MKDWFKERVPFSTLQGKVITDVRVEGDDRILFSTNDGEYVMEHFQDCCESVTIEDICGDWKNIIGEEVVWADESSRQADTEYGESQTWTFYHLVTRKGTVTIRWYGTSNGYYSEAVDLWKVAPE